MAERIVLELPDELAKNARAIAARRDRRVEEVLVEWIDQAVAEPPIELLSDDEVLALCDLQLDPQVQEEFSTLLAANREGTLEDADRARLDKLMRQYRRGLVRKAQAWHVAVARGLRPQLM